jgi:uncharacterized protein YbjT (DUF2867 family)
MPLLRRSYEKILLAGATGHLGQHLLRALKAAGYNVTALVRAAAKGEALNPAPDHLFLADATLPDQLTDCCTGIDVVVSALGKSISLTDKSKGSFRDIDYAANLNLLQEAKKAGVRQFVYISAFAAEEHPELAYFKAHADFSEALKNSGISYTILQPTALFSAFDEVVAMARKGRIGCLGAGDKKTNPVYEGDVASVAVQSIGHKPEIIPLGGSRFYSRLALIELACKAAGYTGAIPKVPFGLVKTLLPLLKYMDRNLYDKVAFMAAVSAADCLAPPVGKLTLEEYFGLVPEKVT